jgi:DNA gyrase inhibitor GyrI
MLVKIVRLPVIKAVSFLSRSSRNPELDAHKQLIAFITENGIEDKPLLYQVYGRNNPISLNSPEKRGYEFLLTIPNDFPADNNVPVTYIGGQLYAVVSARGIKQMQENWGLLVEWIKESSEFTFDYPPGYDYDLSPSLELEHHINPHNMNEKSVLIDYYFPIKKKE